MMKRNININSVRKYRYAFKTHNFRGCERDITFGKTNQAMDESSK